VSAQHMQQHARALGARHAATHCCCAAAATRHTPAHHDSPAQLSAARARACQLQRRCAALAEPQQLHLCWLPAARCWQCLKHQLLQQRECGGQG
jgi:hypothetical protein